MINRLLVWCFLWLGIGHASAEVVGKLAKAVSNNAVVAAKTNGQWSVYSFNGLLPDKDVESVSNLTLKYHLPSRESRVISNVPYSQGRLASIAVTLKNQVYLFGGYTVSQDHQEKSMADVYRFNPATEQYQLFTNMPISVDDTVALVYQQRYIYLISGWHDVGNVSTVQVLDTQNKKWFYATPYPGKAVFGHAAGIVGNQMVVADGVQVIGVKDSKRQFAMSNVSYQGDIDANDFTLIDWKKLPQHPGKGRYRMAAVGLPEQNMVIFAGGSDNPYNYNGIGYNGIPSKPSDEVFAWDLKKQQWREMAKMSRPSMDHRAMLNIDGKLFIVGGMLKGQVVTDSVYRYR